VAVLTFTRSEAATIGDDLTSRLRTLVEHDLTPAAAAITEAEVAPLISRIRRAPYIGTIDGFLRSLLEDLRGAVGFETMPTVGSQPHLEQLHSDCYDTLQETSEYAAPLERLTEAYPAREYAAGVDDLLREALRTCRTHRLDEEEFHAC
jgi:ATP-dependent helicase/nuclease subunit A